MYLAIKPHSISDNVNVMITIRKAKISDIEQLEKLFLLTRIYNFTSRPIDHFQIGDYADSVKDDQVWLGERNNIIVGFVSIYLADNFIHNLFVHPNFQQGGIGSMLLKKARSNLQKPMTLKIAIDNLKACSFYEKHG